MGKIIDWILTGDWEKANRIALYKKLGKLADAKAEEADLEEEEKQNEE